MPRLDGATERLGATEAHAETESVGQPTLIHFWSMSCGICRDNMPRVCEWRDELKDRGLRVIAVHMPRYESDRNVDDMRAAIATYRSPSPAPWITNTNFETLFRTIRVTCLPTIFSTRKESCAVLRQGSEGWTCSKQLSSEF
jgi:thiol-disulfide isomerase/thioredoxin